MSRKPLVWMLAPLLLAALYGCPKKKPQTAEQAVEPQTETVTPPPTAVAPPPTARAEDPVEDPLLSSDLQSVNDELRRRGFSPDVYFAFDESTLSDDARQHWPVTPTSCATNRSSKCSSRGTADERGTNEYNLALGERRAAATRDYLEALGVSADRLRTSVTARSARCAPRARRAAGRRTAAPTRWSALARAAAETAATAAKPAAPARRAGSRRRAARSARRRAR